MHHIRKFGLIGYPLSHSFSKKYFEEKFRKEDITNATYALFPIASISMLPALLDQHPELVGLNVTIPYKQTVFPYLDDIDEGARSMGAVNVIHCKHNRLIGYNSDVFGFQHALLNWYAEAEDQVLKGALILGHGGAASAVSYVLRGMNIPFLYVTRRSPGAQAIGYDAIDSALLDRYPLVINTTPLGTYPQSDTFPPIPYHLLDERNSLFDLVYNPDQTTFMQKGKQRGCRVKNGLEMLERQADKAWEIWNQ